MNVIRTISKTYIRRRIMEFQKCSDVNAKDMITLDSKILLAVSQAIQKEVGFMNVADSVRVKTTSQRKPRNLFNRIETSQD